uniref:Mitochondrial fission process protein 1 n=1 Tax=Sus scrofa TaxID=9823 RepID=A0A5G2QR78_PIG
MSEPPPRGAERDLFRDTWVRYLGYANEVGEAFRSLVPTAVVWLSYGVSSSYVLADAIDKGKKARDVPSPEAGRSTRVTVAVVDTFVWQALASVASQASLSTVCVLPLSTSWALPPAGLWLSASGPLLHWGYWPSPSSSTPSTGQWTSSWTPASASSTPQWRSPAPPDSTLVPGLWVCLFPVPPPSSCQGKWTPSCLGSEALTPE